MIPFRLQILRALSEGFHGLTWTDEKGKTWDLGDSVFRGRVVFGDDDPLPMLSILENPMQPQGSFSGPGGAVVKQPWELVIQGFVKDDKRHPTDPAHYLLAAVKAKLIEHRRTRNVVSGQYDILGMNGKVDSLTFDPGVVRPPDETSSVAHFWLTLYLELVEDVTKPYG